MREMEFRVNLLTWTVIDFFWLGLNWVSVELIFGQIDSIAGWKKEEVLLLVCTVALFYDFLWAFIFTGINSFSRLIRDGNLDNDLLKPVSPRFLVSVRFPEFDHYLRIIFLTFLIRHLLRNLLVEVTFWSWLNYWLIFLLAFFAFYNLLFFLAVTNFWFIRLFNLNDLADAFVSIGRYPTEIFKGKIRFFLTYIIPTAFVAYFPVTVLLGRISPRIIWVALLVVFLTFLGSQWFWQFALRHYQSASS